MDWPLQISSRFFTLSVLLVAILFSSNAKAAENQFPYVAYIVKEGAYVRSGPGQRHYPTSQLQQGYAVEVYRHDGSGWCAIRPPQNSFSLVAAHEVRVLNGELVEVISDHAVARVGSSISTDRSAVQVILPKGERLALAPAQLNGDSRWVGIVAPAGEFRWIAAADLSRQPPVEIAPPLPSPKQSTQPQNQAFEHLIQANAEIESSQKATGFRPPPLAQPIPKTTPGSVEVIAGSPAEMQLSQIPASNSNMLPPPLQNSFASTANIQGSATSTAPRIRLPGSTATTVEKSENVVELELMLSQTVAQPPASWTLDSIQAEALTLLQSTTSSADRVHLRELLTRIERFQAVQREYQKPLPPLRQVSPNQFTAPSPIVPTTTQTPIEPEEVDQLTRVVANVRDRVQEDLRTKENVASADQTKFDAVGKLKPVVSKREQAPPYALVDDRGNVVSFVTPTPDLNLQPYLGQRIGVQGNRGYMPEYRRAHVTAGRVSAVEGTLRR